VAGALEGKLFHSSPDWAAAREPVSTTIASDVRSMGTVWVSSAGEQTTTQTRGEW